MKRIVLIKPLFLIPMLLLVSLSGRSQDSLAGIDISKVVLPMSISSYSASAYIPGSSSLPEQWPTIHFKNGITHKGTVPAKYVTQKQVLRFRLYNPADSAISVWFFPGFYYSNVTIYRLRQDRPEKLPLLIPPIKDNLGYCKITLAAKDSAVFFAELRMIRTYINTIRPRLIHEQRIASFMNDLSYQHNERNMFTYIFCGLLLMMILFSVANYVQGANKEFLYYSGYAFFLGGMLFTKALFDFRPNAVSNFFEEYLDFIMQSLGIMFYMFFMQRFLVTKKNHPFLFRLYNFGIGMLLIAMLTFTFFHYFTDNYTAEAGVENITKLILLAMTIVFLVYSSRHWNDKLLRYLFWGNLCLFIFSMLSLVSTMIDVRFLPGVLGSSILYYEIGIFLELVFFLAGLNQKNKMGIISQTKERERLRTENQLKEYEKEIAVYKAQQEERQRISADMHDELGSGMTAIRLMSEIARNKMKESTPVEIEKISHSADEVLNKMNAIIWSMNSGNDTLDNMVSYIRSYALEYFENTPVECKVTTPPVIEPKEVRGDKRRNIFLSVKETLNNALKHSGATEITIEFEISDILVIRIRDNGTGIDMQKIRQFGNGLKNIARRMEGIGGTYQIENNGGTVTTLSLPV